MSLTIAPCLGNTISFNYVRIDPGPLFQSLIGFNAINDKGQVVGYWGEGPYGVLLDLNNPNQGTFIGPSVPTGISDDGLVVGHNVVSAQELQPAFPVSQAAVVAVDSSYYRNGAFGTQYSGISSDGSQIVGTDCPNYLNSTFLVSCRAGNSFLLHA